MTHEHDPAVMALARDHALTWRMVKMMGNPNTTARKRVIARDLACADGVDTLHAPEAPQQASLSGTPLPLPHARTAQWGRRR